MLTFVPPLQDLSFVLTDVLDAAGVLAAMPRYREIDAQTFDAIAEEAGKFAAEQVAPLNAGADRPGCVWSDGQVAAPPGFAAAYAAWCELGWPSVCADLEHGGQALPRVAFSVISELQAAASHAFVMVTAANQCAAACLRHSASAELHQRAARGLGRRAAEDARCRYRCRYRCRRQ
jgi:alkylation response protein AidB-like acyl-CoA dehydrogenase